MNQPRVLILASGFAPYSFSENLVNSKLALAMIRNGWHVDIISARDEGDSYETAWTDPWLDLKSHTHEIAYTHGSGMRRIVERSFAAVRLNHPIGGVRWAGHALALAEKLHRRMPYDAVISRSVSDFTHLPALHFSRRNHIPWIANWNDPPDYLFPKPYRTGRSAFQIRIWDRYFRSVLKTADCHTFPCERLARHICSYFKYSHPDRVRIIPHLMLCDHTPAGQIDSGHLTIRHAGHLSAERSPEPFFIALRRLIDSRNPRPPVRVEFIGVEKVALNALIEKYGLKPVVSTAGRCSYLDTLNLLASSDVVLIIEAPCTEGVFLPSKFTDCIQAGRPVLSISPLNGTVHDLIREHGGGLAADAGSPDAIYEMLGIVYRLWLEKRLPDLISESLPGMFDPKTILAEHAGILNNLNSVPDS
ncbi:glycosyltransferase [bacterium]|nr:glycosyltransferase [candidate division CSSED10-310 bacterium]